MFLLLLIFCEKHIFYAHFQILNKSKIWETKSMLRISIDNFIIKIIFSHKINVDKKQKISFWHKYNFLNFEYFVNWSFGNLMTSSFNENEVLIENN